MLFRSKSHYEIIFRVILSHSHALPSFLFSADMGVVGRNCTEDGWSEPFPHYFDACGFDDYEPESGDQVSKVMA